MRLLTFYSLLITVLLSCTSNDEVSQSKIFKFNIVSGLTSLDPAFASNKPKWWVTNQIFNGLVQVDSTLSIIPCLAKSWHLSGDRKKYLFVLHNDVFFHDSPAFLQSKGKRMTAQDVVYSINRILTTGSGAWTLNDKLLQEDGQISKNAIVALNDTLVEFNLNQPCPFFLHILSMPYCYIVPEEAVTYYGKSFRNNPVGTGPFQLKEWYEDSKLILSKNNNYWRSKLNNQLPKLDYVQISFIPDANQEFRLFTSKQLDFVFNLEEGTRDELFELDGTINQRFLNEISVQRSPYLITDYLGFQLDTLAQCYQKNSKHPFLDVNVRRALDAAVDKQALVNYCRSGLGYPGNEGLVPRGIKKYSSKVAKHKTDAIEYLKKSEFYKTINSYSLQLQTNPINKSMAEFLQKQWEQELGVFVEVDVCDGGTLLDLANNGKSTFFYANWIADYPDPENFMSILYSPNFKPKGPNKMHYKNREADSLFLSASMESDNTVRFENYAKMDSITMEDQAIIPLFHEESVWLYHNNVSAISNNPVGLLDLEKVSVH